MSSSCDLGGSGVPPSSPYCTISAALAAHHAPGTLIHVLPGVYHEQVTVSWSGQPGAPIVIEADPSPGHPVVIDGADDLSDPSLWAPFAGEVWVAPSVSWSPTQVFADSARLTPSADPVSSLAPGTFAYVSGQGLYVNAGGGNPGSHHAAVGRRPYGFYVSNRSWVSLVGFTVTRSEYRGIMVTNGSNNIEVRRNLVNLSGRVGVQVLGCSAVLLDGNAVSDNSDDGISLTAGTSGCTVQGNECFRNVVPGSSGADGIYLYGAVGNRIQRNRFHDNDHCGENLANGSNDNVSIENVAWNNGQIGYDHLGASGNVHNGDVSFANHWDGFALDGGSTATALYNCIAVANGLLHSRFDLEVDSTSTPGFSSNDNIIWNPSGSDPVRYAGQSYERLAAYVTMSGQDTRTIQSDPLFMDPTNGDFRLLPASPGIDAANSATPSWPSTDAAGEGRLAALGTPRGLGPVPYADRGAFEYVPGDWAPAVGDSVPRLDHVIVVVMENKAYDQVRVAPYMADLISHSSSFSQSYAYQHQSQSDYYALWSAVGRGVTETICPAVGSPYDSENLGHLCETHGVTWRAYSEGLPSPGDPVCQKHFYARRHCPWTDWGNLNHMNERSYDDFAIDAAAGTLPQMAFVIPDLCDDEHDYCGQDTIKIGDDWLSNNVPAMVKAVGPRGAVIVTWDEDDGSDGNRILTVFTGPMVKPGFVSRRFINHFSIARTICEALGLPLFAEAATSTAVTDVWIGQSPPSPRDPLPPGVSLGPAFPNPFRNSVSVTLQVPSQQTVEAAVYDVTGRRVKSLLRGSQSGLVQIRWDGTGDDGRAVRAGVYFLRVRHGGTWLGTRLVLLN